MHGIQSLQRRSAGRGGIHGACRIQVRRRTSTKLARPQGQPCSSCHRYQATRPPADALAAPCSPGWWRTGRQREIQVVVLHFIQVPAVPLQLLLVETLPSHLLQLEVRIGQRGVACAPVSQPSLYSSLGACEHLHAMSACFDAGWASTASATRALRGWPPLLCAASFNFAGKQFALRVPAAGPAGGPAMRRSQTADPSDELSVKVVRMRQELKAVGQERDAFIAHINAVHERLAADRSKYPSASCAGILKLTLQETVRERDLLRGHVDELHRQLAEQAFEAAAAKVENARRSASPRPPKQLSQHDREEAQKRIRQSIEKNKKANVEQAIEEAQRKELAALFAGRKWARKLPGATLDER
mmetsp:Transcript_13477/g.43990  ORF Transcript_13477/g.43990 Transcript_13477/m.43990 type:complete len:358 (-) Transcript_13477:870-1943(-)